MRREAPAELNPFNRQTSDDLLTYCSSEQSGACGNVSGRNVVVRFSTLMRPPIKSIGITAAAADIALPVDTYVSVASTGPLPAGIYYASATADLEGSAGTSYCKITGSAGSVPINWGGGYSTGLTQAAETTVATVPGNTVLTETCYGESSDQYAYDAAIMAIRITSSSAGTMPTALPHRIVPGLPKASPGVIIGPPKS
jgi:hypothetical protein